MENISILDQIINNYKAEEIDSLDAVEIINNLFNKLSERERDIIIRRYGLCGDNKETLESIGDIHKLTRERIRQIETASIKKLQQLENLENYINTLRKVIFQLLEEHGGLMEKEYLLDILAAFSLNGLKIKAKDKDEIIHKNYLNFLITKLLHNKFEEVANSKLFKNSYKLKYQNTEHLKELMEELLVAIQEIKKIHKTKELIHLVSELESFKKHQEKIAAYNKLDISKVLKFELFEENNEIINSNKPLYSILRATRKIKQNKFGYWGMHNWPEITPKTVNDKIYLVLKNQDKPMHFAEIADRINQIAFDKKQAHPATVHNELILDNKYVLVGRGLYGLAEKGYKQGAVVDIIEYILSKAQSPLSQEEIIDRVLEQRLVKKTTVILALMDKNRFEKVGGKYEIRSKKEARIKN